jgi:hypothetical protein
MTIVASGPDRVYLVCEGCAKVLEKAGAVRAPAPIEAGHACDTHQETPCPTATAAFEGTPASVAALFAVAEPAPVSSTSPPPPAAGGGLGGLDLDPEEV